MAMFGYFVIIALHFGDPNNFSLTYRKCTYLLNLGIYQYEQHRLLNSTSFNPIKRNAKLSYLYTPQNYFEGVYVMGDHGD